MADCAAGIHALVNARMADGVRVATVRRGVDPRDYALLAFGGAAGLHAGAVASELGLRRAVVPLFAAGLSAWGMLHTDLRYEIARSALDTGGGLPDDAALRAVFDELEAEARARVAGWFGGEVVGPARRRHALRRAGLRDRGAARRPGLGRARPRRRACATPSTPATAPSSPTTCRKRRWCWSTPGCPRSAACPLSAARRAAGGQGARGAGRAPPHPPRRSRRVEAPVFRFAALAPDQALEGPAIVESETTTVLLRPGDRARMDGRGWLDIAVPAAAATG